MAKISHGSVVVWCTVCSVVLLVPKLKQPFTQLLGHRLSARWFPYLRFLLRSFLHCYPVKQEANPNCARSFHRSWDSPRPALYLPYSYNAIYDTPRLWNCSPSFLEALAALIPPFNHLATSCSLLYIRVVSFFVWLVVRGKANEICVG